MVAGWHLHKPKPAVILVLQRAHLLGQQQQLHFELLHELCHCLICCSFDAFTPLLNCIKQALQDPTLAQLCADSVESPNCSDTDPGQAFLTCCVNLIQPLVENSNVIWIHEGLGICTRRCCFSFLRCHGYGVVLFSCVPVAISMDRRQTPGKLHVGCNNQLVGASGPRHCDDELSIISKTTPRLFDFLGDLDC